jgi:hypothetical protein
MIEASQRMINEQNNNPIVNIHLKLEIKTLQNAARDPDRLEQLLQVKERQKEEECTLKTQKGWLQKRLKCSRLYCVRCIESSNDSSNNSVEQF